MHRQILRPLFWSLALALAAPAAQAARFTYHGELLDGGAPAAGRYDLRLRALPQPGAKQALGEPTELPAVEVVGGRFSVELELPEDGDGSTWVEIALRPTGSGRYAVLGPPQPLAKANSTCPGAWALDGNSGTPAGSYLGHADARTVFINSPTGAAFNSNTELGTSNFDVVIRPKANGDADADLRLLSRNGKAATQFLNDTTGNLVLSSGSGRIELFSGYTAAQQADGRSVLDVDGRLRSQAAGTAAGDLGGGLWLDGSAPGASFVGRGLNGDGYTGIYGGNAWRFAVSDAGQTTVGGTPLPFEFPQNSAELLVRAQFGPSPSIALVSSSGKQGFFSLIDATGGFKLDAPFKVIGEDFLRTGNGASLSAGGVWTNASSRALKEAFAAVDPDAILDRVLQLPLSTWRYKDAAQEGRHLGPMAEDFKAAFGLGGDGRAIGTVDADGVALAAIQGLHGRLRHENAELRAELDALAARHAALQSRVERLLQSGTATD